MQIPDGPTGLTCEWLTAALRTGGAIAQAQVKGRSIQALNQGLYSQIVRVRLFYDREETGAPASLIAKFSSDRPALRVRAIGAYQKEIHFYQELAPQSDLPTPTCIYADIDPASGRHVLLLEDLAPAQSGSRVAGCTPDRAALAVTELAAFHATWWEHPNLQALDWLPDPDFGLEPEARRAEYNRWWEHFLRRIDRPLPKPILEIGKRLGAQRAQIEHHLFNASPRTLLHGDFHLDNLFFAGPDGGAPFGVVDWQMLRRGRGVRDAAYFLSESLLPKDRRNVEMDLLHTYHRRLVAGGVSGYPFSECLRDYRLSLLQRFRALVSTIAVMPFREADRRMHVEVLLPRNVAALLDHDARQLLE